MKAGTLEIELITNVARLQKEMKDVQRSVSDAMGKVANDAKAANDNFSRFGKAVTGAGQSSKLAGHHVQNLAFQLQDVVVGLQGGQKPLTVLMQQGSQIGGIMMQAGIGVRGLTAALFTMAAPFAPIIAALGFMAGGLALVTSEINANSKVHVTWKDTLLGAYDMVKSYLSGQVTGAFKAFGIDVGDVWATIVEGTKTAINFIIGVGTLAPRLLINAFKTLPAGIADAFYISVNFGIRAINGLVERAVAIINKFSDAVNPILAKAGLAIPKLIAPQIGELKNAYSGAGAAAASAFGETIKDTWKRDYIGDVADALTPFAQARAKKRMAETAKEAGKAAGKGAGQAAGDAFVDEFAKALEKLGASVNAFLQNGVQKLRDDPMFGADPADDIEKQIKRGEDAKEFAKLYADIVHERHIKTARAMAAVFGGGVARDLNRVIDAFEGIRTGDFSAVGGRLGDSLSALNTPEMREAFKPVVGELKKVGKSIGLTFGKDSPLGQTLGKISAGAEIGTATAGIMKALGIKTSTTGAQLGGALGSLAGPLGSLAGSIAGGIVGGLMKKTKWGRVDLTSSGMTQAGNSGASVGAAVQAGGAFTSGLADIASQLGGTVGDFGSVSIGQRHGDWRVNGGGTSLKIKGGAIEFDGDAEAAITYAIELALERGAITGIRNSTQNLLKASGDMERKLSNALKFEGVFSELKSIIDPVGYAIETLDKQFAQLRDIFAQAGASAAEYADLEALYQLKREAAIVQADEPGRERRTLEIRAMEAQGNAVAALAAQRAMELDQIDASLRPLQAYVWRLEDAAEVAQKFGDIITGLQSYRASLFGGSNSGASYAASLTKLMTTGGLASTGDVKALGQLQGVSDDFLAVAKDSARTAAEYQRAVALVAGYVDGGIEAAQSQIDYAKSQAESLNTAVELLTSLDSNIATVTMQSPAVISTSSGSVSSNAELLTEIKALRVELTNQGASSARVAQLLGRWDRGASMAVTADTASPVPVSVIP